MIDSRLNQTSEITRRRRLCGTCEGRFTTYERVEELMPVVIKKDGRRETFSREKLLDGIRKPCQKRPVTTEEIETAVDAIERRIQSYGLKEIPSKTIGQMVMSALHKLDTVAYVRFSAVYREFSDVEGFLAELQHQPAEPEEPGTLTFPFAGSGPEGNA